MSGLFSTALAVGPAVWYAAVAAAAAKTAGTHTRQWGTRLEHDAVGKGHQHSTTTAVGSCHFQFACSVCVPGGSTGGDPSSAAAVERRQVACSQLQTAAVTVLVGSFHSPSIERQHRHAMAAPDAAHVVASDHLSSLYCPCTVQCNGVQQSMRMTAVLPEVGPCSICLQLVLGGMQQQWQQQCQHCSGLQQLWMLHPWGCCWRLPLLAGWGRCNGSARCSCFGRLGAPVTAAVCRCCLFLLLQVGCAGAKQQQQHSEYSVQ